MGYDDITNYAFGDELEKIAKRYQSDDGKKYTGGGGLTVPSAGLALLGAGTYGTGRSMAKSPDNFLAKLNRGGVMTPKEKALIKKIGRKGKIGGALAAALGLAGVAGGITMSAKKSAAKKRDRRNREA